MDVNLLIVHVHLILYTAPTIVTPNLVYEVHFASRSPMMNHRQLTLPYFVTPSMLFNIRELI
jgi:hypothetical protein